MFELEGANVIQVNFQHCQPNMINGFNAHIRGLKRQAEAKILGGNEKEEKKSKYYLMRGIHLVERNIICS